MAEVCFHCKESVKPGATTCPHCGKSPENPAKGCLYGLAAILVLSAIIGAWSWLRGGGPGHDERMSDAKAACVVQVETEGGVDLSIAEVGAAQVEDHGTSGDFEVRGFVGGEPWKCIALTTSGKHGTDFNAVVRIGT